CPLPFAPKYAIHARCKSAKAGHQQTAVISRGKGNPMKAYARHVPGSTRGRRPALSQCATPPRRFQTVPEKCDHYASKMRPNFKTQILINSLQTTYNFDTQKWSHFPGRGSSLALGDLSVRGVGRSRNSPKVKAEGRARGQRASHWDRVRDKLVNPRPSEAAWQQNLQTCTESSKSAKSPISYRFDHAVPTTYDDQNRRSPIFPLTHSAFFTLNSALKEAVRIPFFASLPSLRPSSPRPGRNRKKPEFPES